MKDAATIETFKSVKHIPLADADGRAIREGSVLVNIEDGARGVVTEIGREGHRPRIPIMAYGDIIIQQSPGCYRGTNRYSEWRHVPHNDQTYDERFRSWMLRHYEHDEDLGISRDEGCAIDGIMSLLRDDVVDWQYGPWPYRLEDALRFLVAQLSTTPPAPAE